MKKKNVLVLSVLFVFASSFLMSCGNKVNVVKDIPSGFVKLNIAEDNLDVGGLHYTIGESQISFLDADEICTYQTELKDTQFIVKHENEYYVNEKKYSELVAMAKGVTVQRNTQYSNGDTIELRGIGLIPYTVEFFDVLSYSDGKIKLCRIRFIMGPNIPENKQSQIFSYIETDKGTIIKDYEYTAGIFEVLIPVEEKIKIIVIKSPDYPGCIRKIINGSNIKVVQTKPEGYIQLDKATDNHGNAIDYMVFENGITFFDADRIGIYGAVIYDQSFLVIYEDEWYVNEKKYLEIVKISDAVSEKRNKIYSIGDDVELRGCDVNYKDGYSIKINEVKADTDGSIYTIQFSISPYVTEYKRKEIFDHVETDRGTIINEFTFIGDAEVQVTVPVGEKINMIVVKSPDYDHAIRKINVSY
ncbi:MAG TPA: hypothetical protein PK629_05130 [Oscillospiraceae bacterium]|nr:hypothetical protein [Oscillospiraceae bacterium]HPF01486.1 hypothetical protein [Bacteroidales bacterium]HPK36493.1 hypothetical protein [Oscillospiraceae bacterium]HPR76447.1 hypothetical protein [Oscillospiraceae bacterium]